MKNKILIGALLCFIAAVSWGAMFPVAYSAFRFIDPFYFTIFRYGTVTIILAGILYWREGRKAFRLEGKGLPLWFYGTMAFTVYNLFIFLGQDLLGQSGVMAASIMESLMPMISIVIAWIFLKHRPLSFTLVCVLFSFAGACFVITKGDIQSFFRAADSIIPVFLLLIAVISWVIYTIGGSRFDGWSPLRYSTLSCLLGTLTAFIITIGATLFGVVSFPVKNDLVEVVPHLLFMIIFPGVIALLGWNIGVSLLSPLNGLLFINFVPVTTLFISLIQGYALTIFETIGTIFIISALISNNIFLRFVEKRKSNVQKSQTFQERPL